MSLLHEMPQAARVLKGSDTKAGGHKGKPDDKADEKQICHVVSFHAFSTGYGSGCRCCKSDTWLWPQMHSACSRLCGSIDMR